jgi:hypothetical protein
MVILITPDGYYVESGDAPEVGRKYALELADTPTQRQNKAFHALLMEYWVSGAHSYIAKNYEEFRDFIKRDLGAGFCLYHWFYWDGEKIVKGKCKNRSDIPKCAEIIGKLKSWSDYTKKERTETIDRLIAEMIQAGVNTRKFSEILEGMEAEK